MKKELPEIKLPEGGFCGGNCSTCVFWDRHNQRSDGRAYCNKMNTYYRPDERNGCFHYEEY